MKRITVLILTAGLLVLTGCAGKIASFNPGEIMKQAAATEQKITQQISGVNATITKRTDQVRQGLEGKIAHVNAGVEDVQEKLGKLEKAVKKAPKHAKTIIREAPVEIIGGLTEAAQDALFEAVEQNGGAIGDALREFGSLRVQVEDTRRTVQDVVDIANQLSNRSFLEKHGPGTAIGSLIGLILGAIGFLLGRGWDKP